jgi:hypothetical protein
MQSHLPHFSPIIVGVFASRLQHVVLLGLKVRPESIRTIALPNKNVQIRARPALRKEELQSEAARDEGIVLPEQRPQSTGISKKSLEISVHIEDLLPKWTTCLRECLY